MYLKLHFVAAILLPLALAVPIDPLQLSTREDNTIIDKYEAPALHRRQSIIGLIGGALGLGPVIDGLNGIVVGLGL